MQAEASELSLKESAQRWWLLGLLSTAMFFCYAHRGALSVAAPFLIQELHLNPASMGVLLSAFFWSYSLLQIPGGWIADKFGVRWSYAAGFALWAGATALTGFATGLISLIGFRILLGMGQSVAFPASARAVANWFPDRERGLVTGMYLSGSRLGQAFVTAAGGVLLVNYSWRMFFLVLGLASLIWILPWVRFLRPWEAASVRGSGKGSSMREMIALLKERKIAGIFAGFLAYDYVWFLFLTWMPGYLMLERKFTPKEMGIYSAVPFIAMFFVLLLAGIVSDLLIRRGYREVLVRKWFITAGFIVSLAMVPAAFVDDKSLCVWLLIVAICGLGIVAPNTWTLTQAVCEKPIVGTASGIQNFGGNLGGVVAPALTGYIAHVTHSFALAFCIAGGVSIAGIVIYWVLIPSQPVATERDANSEIRR